MWTHILSEHSKTDILSELTQNRHFIWTFSSDWSDLQKPHMFLSFDWSLTNQHWLWMRYSTKEGQLTFSLLTYHWQYLISQPTQECFNVHMYRIESYYWSRYVIRLSNIYIITQRTELILSLFCWGLCVLHSFMQHYLHNINLYISFYAFCLWNWVTIYFSSQIYTKFSGKYQKLLQRIVGFDQNP